MIIFVVLFGVVVLRGYFLRSPPRPLSREELMSKFGDCMLPGNMTKAKFVVCVEPSSYETPQFLGKI
jgi:hypothetical protein